ncbi:MAG: Fe-S-containing hydro-lyase [Firmicutes bacterium]|nr:Fe-S-containing hydro-lyase [Bacillota bacterium]
MKKVISITTPVTTEQIRELRAGDNVEITGYIYTGRDAAHKRLVDLVKAGKELPIDVNGQFIYYVGPSPAKPGHVIGSAGPTTSYRMDPYSPTLLELGLKGMIGKGKIAPEVIEALKEHGAVYFGAVGGAAALISKSIKKVEVVCYEDLGAEAIHRFYVEKFPATVVVDSEGNNLYETEPLKYSLP